MDETLRLETPSEFTSFPYTPYSIQLDLMKSLYAAIEGRKVAIMESPTGTGKTLSILCSSLTWLVHERERAKHGKLAELAGTNGGSNEPDWILEQTLEMHRRDLEASEKEFEEKLEKARRRERQMKEMEHARARKRQKVSHQAQEDEAEDDLTFLPDDDDTYQADETNISAANRELMQKLDSSKAGTKAGTEHEPICTKIFYASRTHSQLSQLKLELLKTTHAATRAVPLASRKHLCINDDIRKRGDVDEACRELLHEKKGRRCPYLPAIEEESKMLDMRDAILATPKDIEDLHLTGQYLHTCPYFGTRRAIPQAELVILPYNLLLSRVARESLGIDLQDHVVVIDEAHNLIDTILSIHTVTLTSATLKTCLSQLKVYLHRFRTRLTARHSLHLKQLVVFLVALSKVCQDFQGTEARQDTLLSPAEFSALLGSKGEGINLLEIESYLRRSHIARKISSYCDKQEEKDAGKGATKVLERRKGQTPLLHAIEAFLVALTNATQDGRISVSASGGLVTLKYQLLNPSIHFQEIVDKARCVVLAGGTMSPISDLRSQLFAQLPDERFTVFTCGHVIPKENLAALVINKGPGGSSMEFKMANRSDKSLISELGRTLLNLTGLVPNGLVVFFPSYSFLGCVKSSWTEDGTLDRLNSKKKLFFEPQESNQVDIVLKEYSEAARLTIGGKGGALLMAVVGAKLSEGLNFSDELARAVILVGLPFPNITSMELKERMRYVNDLQKQGILPRVSGSKDAGAELYENLAMRAVNQSIGRAIRHRTDWATLILLDIRYGSPRIRTKLPGWIGERLTVAPNFGQAVKDISAFFRSKRSQPDQ